MAKAKVSHLQETQKSQPTQSSTLADEFENKLNKLADLNDCMFDLGFILNEWKPGAIPIRHRMPPTALVNFLSDRYEELSTELSEFCGKLRNKGGAA